MLLTIIFLVTSNSITYLYFSITIFNTNILAVMLTKEVELYSEAFFLCNPASTALKYHSNLQAAHALQ